jgi:MFS transporter, DHA1 family, multidrug resistance protein
VTAAAPKYQHRGSRLGLAILLASLSMVSPFSIDTFFPSFPAMSAEFHLNAWQIQQTLTVYMLAYAFMSLVHGPLSDALGRRPIVLWGLSIYTFASVACALSPNFASLLMFRTLQGMTAGSGLAVGRAVVRDLYDGPQAQKLMSTIMVIFGIAPALAPVIGGWIHVLLGWRSVFGFMALIGVALLGACAVRLPETHPPEQRLRLIATSLAATAIGVARHREFALLALASGLSFAAVIGYIGAAPAIVLDQWHLSETQFAWLFVPVIGGFVAGALVSGRLAGRAKRRRQLRLGLGVTTAAAVVLVLLYASGKAIPIPLQQLALFGVSLGVQISAPVLALRMLDLFPHARGSAVSVQSFVTILISSLVMGVLVPALHGSLLLLAIASLTASVLAYVIALAATR